MILFKPAVIYLFMGSLVWALTIDRAACALREPSLRASRFLALQLITVFTILAWPYVIWRHAKAYVKGVQWRRAR